MIIPIRENLRIDGSDGHNWTIQTKRTIQGTKGRPTERVGEEVWDDKGHYPNLEQACKSVLKKALVNGQQETGIMTVLELLDELGRNIVDAIKSTALASGRLLDPPPEPKKYIPKAPPPRPISAKSPAKPGRPRKVGHK